MQIGKFLMEKLPQTGAVTQPVCQYICLAYQLQLKPQLHLLLFSLQVNAARRKLYRCSCSHLKVRQWTVNWRSESLRSITKDSVWAWAVMRTSAVSSETPGVFDCLLHSSWDHFNSYSRLMAKTSSIWDNTCSLHMPALRHESCTGPNELTGWCLKVWMFVFSLYNLVIAFLLIIIIITLTVSNAPCTIQSLQGPARHACTIWS